MLIQMIGNYFHFIVLKTSIQKLTLFLNILRFQRDLLVFILFKWTCKVIVISLFEKGKNFIIVFAKIGHIVSWFNLIILIETSP